LKGTALRKKSNVFERNCPAKKMQKSRSLIKRKKRAEKRQKKKKGTNWGTPGREGEELNPALLFQNTEKGVASRHWGKALAQTRRFV